MNKLTRALVVVILSVGLVFGQPPAIVQSAPIYKYKISYVTYCIRKFGSAYWSDKANLDALVWIATKESSLIPGAVNPKSGAFGLYQIMPPSKCPANRDLWYMMKRGGDPITETKAGCTYIKRRYGTPVKAKAFWLRKGWY